MSRDVFHQQKKYAFFFNPSYSYHQRSRAFFHEEKKSRRRPDRVAARKKKNVLHAISSITRNDVCVCLYLLAENEKIDESWIGFPVRPCLRMCGLLMRHSLDGADNSAPALFESKNNNCAGNTHNFTHTMGGGVDFTLGLLGIVSTRPTPHTHTADDGSWL